VKNAFNEFSTNFLIKNLIINIKSNQMKIGISFYDRKQNALKFKHWMPETDTPYSKIRLLKLFGGTECCTRYLPHPLKLLIVVIRGFHSYRAKDLTYFSIIKEVTKNRYQINGWKLLIKSSNMQFYSIRFIVLSTPKIVWAPFQL